TRGPRTRRHRRRAPARGRAPASGCGPNAIGRLRASCLLFTTGQQKGPLNWERAGGFALSRLRAYARCPLPSVGVAGFRIATAFSVQLCDMSEPPESINPKALIFTERYKYTRPFEPVKGWARPGVAARRTGSTGRPSSRRCLARATPSPRGVRDRRSEASELQSRVDL